MEKLKLPRVIASYVEGEGGNQRQNALVRLYVRLCITFGGFGKLDIPTREIRTNKTKYGIVVYFNENASEARKMVNKGRVYEYIKVYVNLGLAREEGDGTITLMVPDKLKPEIDPSVMYGDGDGI